MPFGVHRKKSCGKRTFPKQPSEEIGDLKSQKENVGRATNPKGSGKNSIAQKAGAP